jgi:hypothetical protein
MPLIRCIGHRAVRPPRENIENEFWQEMEDFELPAETLDQVTVDLAQSQKINEKIALMLSKKNQRREFSLLGENSFSSHAKNTGEGRSAPMSNNTNIICPVNETGSPLTSANVNE